MLHKLKVQHEISGVRMLEIADHAGTEGRAAHPNLQPDGDRIRADISLCRTQHWLFGRFTAKRGSSSWLCRTRGKLILFTFNPLFPPLWNLERAKSCNTCIKNKCSRNGPTGRERPLWPGQEGLRRKSNRYALYSSAHSWITITHT